MLKSDAFLKPLLAHPVAIFGGGVSGAAAVRLVEKLGGQAQVFDRQGTRSVGMTDGGSEEAGQSKDLAHPPLVANSRAEFTPQDAQAHRLVITSPAFSPTHPWILAARAAGAVVWGELDFASSFWRGSVVAVTGTNGKTTLTEFLTYALRSIGRDAYGVGNIGQAFTQVVLERGGGAPDSVAVCEVSSFQAEALRSFRADAALWTNFAEDHLERHESLEAYFLAKWRLFERTIGGDVFAGSSVQRAADKFGQSLPDGAAVETEDQSGDVLLRGTVFAEYPQRENFLLAAAWWRASGLREGALYAAAQTFKLGPHRLTKVAERDGVTWWNDSKATNFHATEAALSHFLTPVLLIAGGKAKGGDIAAFVQRIAPQVRTAFLIGETSPVLATGFDAAEVPHQTCANLANAVQAAARHARPGDHVLLSPGFASFDQFRGYADRGAQFELLVNHLGAEALLK